MTRQFLRTAANLPLTFELDEFDVRFFLGDEAIAALPQPQRMRVQTGGFTHVVKRFEGQPIGLTAENVAMIERTIQAAVQAYKASPQYVEDSKI